jgi:uncharacterized membrane protein
MRSSRTVLFVAAASLFEAARHWVAAPEVVASHFGATGAPDAYAPRTVFFTLQVMVTLLILGLTVGLPASLARVPTPFINLPHRAYWLDPSRREATLHTIATFFASFGTGTLLLILVAFELAVAANSRPDHRFDTGLFWPVLGIYVILVAYWTVRFYRRFAWLPPGVSTPDLGPRPR